MLHRLPPDVEADRQARSAGSQDARSASTGPTRTVHRSCTLCEASCGLAFEVAEERGIEAVFVTVESVNPAGSKMEVDRQIRFLQRDKCRYRFPIHNQLRGFREDRVGLSSLTVRAVYATDLTDRLARSVAGPTPGP